MRLLLPARVDRPGAVPLAQAPATRKSSNGAGPPRLAVGRASQGHPDWLEAVTHPGTPLPQRPPGGLEVIEVGLLDLEPAGGVLRQLRQLLGAEAGPVVLIL